MFLFCSACVDFDRAEAGRAAHWRVLAQLSARGAHLRARHRVTLVSSAPFSNKSIAVASICRPVLAALAAVVLMFVRDDLAWIQGAPARFLHLSFNFSASWLSSAPSSFVLDFHVNSLHFLFIFSNQDTICCSRPAHWWSPCSVSTRSPSRCGAPL